MKTTVKRYVRFHKEKGFYCGTKGNYYNGYNVISSYSWDLNKARVVKNKPTKYQIKSGEILIEVDVTLDAHTEITQEKEFNYVIVPKGSSPILEDDKLYTAKTLDDAVSKMGKDFNKLYDIVPVKVTSKNVMDIRVV